ncbi:MAG: hypothetical protein ACOX5R_17355 [bacterium]|jgi:hypothetical protein
MPVAGERLEFCSNQDRFCDYCLWDYQPLTSVDQKFRSVNLLYHSFAYAGLDDRVYALCDAIREGIGAFQTVWGIKQAGGRLSWEFYFYDYGRLERKVSITRLLQIIKPFIPCTLIYSENRPYFMFSIEIDHRHINHRQRLDEIDIYIGNVGSSVSSGICYALTGTGLRLDNFYFFFDAKTERENIVGKIACSAHLDLPGFRLRSVLIPELVDCKTIVVANKKHNEGIYFSRINVRQLLFFMNLVGYPEDLISFVDAHQSSLDHLLYDVGFDYVEQDGKIEILKSSYYGIF